jgi:hypothetical protein
VVAGFGVKKDQVAHVGFGQDGCCGNPTANKGLRRRKNGKKGWNGVGLTGLFRQDS